MCVRFTPILPVPKCRPMIRKKLPSFLELYRRSGTPRNRPWRIMLETLPIFLFFYSPIIHLIFFFIILFFSIMPVLILQILILRCDTQSHTDNTQTNNDTNYIIVYIRIVALTCQVYLIASLCYIHSCQNFMVKPFLIEFSSLQIFSFTYFSHQSQKMHLFFPA